MPNTHDTGTSSRQADGTQGITHKPGNNTEPRIVTRDARIVGYDETGTPRIFFGIVPELGNEPVLATSLDGVNVLTALGTT